MYVLHAPHVIQAECMDRLHDLSMLSAAFFPHGPIRINSPSYLACAQDSPCMLRHAAAAILPISQPAHCASFPGRARTLAMRATFGCVPGNSSWRDLPSGLLLVPLRACQVHTFPTRGPLHVTCAAALLPFGMG